MGLGTTMHRAVSVRVLMGSGKPGKSWNFFMAFFRTGKSWKKDHWSWAVLNEVYGRQQGELILRPCECRG